MRIALLTLLTMFAFAANSILTRLAIDGGFIDPSGFAILRVMAGALVLGMLISLRGGGLPLLRRNRIPGAVSLTVYMIAFSLAYLTLDAGLGALILFGVTQVTMFTYGALRETAPTARQLTGAGIAFLGLLIALWPGPGGTADPIGALLMVFAGIGWGAYSIVGRRATDPLAATSANFLLCLPLMLIFLAGAGLSFSPQGVALALVCGGLTSGLGYALWYHVLPKLAGATAAVVQLSVPIIAILAGAVFLGESIGLLLVVSAALVVGGIAWAVTSGSAQADRR